MKVLVCLVYIDIPGGPREQFLSRSFCFLGSFLFCGKNLRGEIDGRYRTYGGISPYFETKANNQQLLAALFVLMGWIARIASNCVCVVHSACKDLLGAQKTLCEVVMFTYHSMVFISPVYSLAGSTYPIPGALWLTQTVSRGHADGRSPRVLVPTLTRVCTFKFVIFVRSLTCDSAQNFLLGCDARAPQVAAALEPASVIRQVDLSFNAIGIDGALALARSLKGKTSFEVSLLPSFGVRVLLLMLVVGGGGGTCILIFRR